MTTIAPATASTRYKSTKIQYRSAGKPWPGLIDSQVPYPATAAPTRGWRRWPATDRPPRRSRLRRSAVAADRAHHPRGQDHRLRRLAAGRQRPGPERVRRSVAVVGGRARGVLGVAVAPLRRARGPGRRAGAGRRPDAGRALVRGNHDQLRAQRAADRGHRAGPDRGNLPFRIRAQRNAELRRTGRRCGAGAGRAASARDRPRRPGRGLRAQHPRR